MNTNEANPKLKMLQEAIDRRQDELLRVADALATSAQKFRRYAGWGRVLLITLGAFTATQGTWEKLVNIQSEHLLIAFTIFGILTSIIVGVEAFFKCEAKGAELNLLAASCHSTVRKTDAARCKIEIATTVEEQIKEAVALVELQNAKLGQIQEKAANSGINITLTIHRHYQELNPSHPE